ncbi:MAG: hypothetical protein IJF46_03405 [Bacteroidaceae bacterium]|nr:hypothetical protein [Bacteroidaceae bacterium]
MKGIKKNLLSVFALLLPMLLASCHHDVHFLEDRIVGTWVSVEEDRFVYIERTLTFTADGHWSGTIRTEDYYGVVVDTDMGAYDIRRDELLLQSYIYDDIQSYGVEIRGSRLYLWDDSGETVYQRH